MCAQRLRDDVPRADANPDRRNSLDPVYAREVSRGCFAFFQKSDIPVLDALNIDVANSY